MADPIGCDGDALLRAIAQMVTDACLTGPWQEVEPQLADSWERLRKPTCPEWHEVAGHVRQYFEL